MLESDINRIIGENEKFSPISLCNIDYCITKNRKKYPFRATKIICKGTVSDIKKSNNTKRRVLRSYFLGLHNAREKINKFDFSKIEIKSVDIVKFLGYGVK